MVVLRVKHVKSRASFFYKGDFGTIAHLKTHIQNYHGILVRNQILVHEGSLLPDNRTQLDDLDIKGKAKMKLFIKLPPQPIKVEIKTDTDTLEFEVASSESVLSLKMRIDERKGVSPNRQNLTVMGTPMHEDHAIDEYITCKQPIFYLTETPPDPRFNVMVNVIVLSTEKVMAMLVEEYDTVYTLHGMVRREGLAAGHDFYLVWEDERLSGLKNFHDYKIRNGANLYLIYEDDQL